MRLLRLLTGLSRIASHSTLLGCLFISYYLPKPSDWKSFKYEQYIYSDSFPIRFDRLDILVKHTSNLLCIQHYIDDQKTLLKSDYKLVNNNLISLKTIILDSSANIIFDTSLNNIQFDAKNKKYSSLMLYRDLQLDIKAEFGAISTVSSFANDENKFVITYYFEKDSLVGISAQDQSKRFQDYMRMYENKLVSFETKIKEPIDVGKGDDGEYWIDNYLVTIDKKTMHKIKGKKVRITGRMVIIKGYTSPDRVRVILSTGAELPAQTFEVDVKNLVNPTIKILSN